MYTTPTTLPLVKALDGTDVPVGVCSGNDTHIVLYLPGGGARTSYDPADDNYIPAIIAAPKGTASGSSAPVATGTAWTSTFIDNRISGNLLMDKDAPCYLFTDNPTHVLIPYVSQDLWTGTTATYHPPTGEVYWTEGRNIFEQAIIWVGNNYPNIDKLTVVGASAGGFGVTSNFHRLMTWASNPVSPLNGADIRAINGFGWSVPFDQCEDCGEDTREERFAEGIASWGATSHLPSYSNAATVASYNPQTIYGQWPDDYKRRHFLAQNIADGTQLNRLCLPVSAGNAAPMTDAQQACATGVYNAMRDSFASGCEGSASMNGFMPLLADDFTTPYTHGVYSCNVANYSIGGVTLADALANHIYGDIGTDYVQYVE